MISLSLSGPDLIALAEGRPADLSPEGARSLEYARAAAHHAESLALEAAKPAVPLTSKELFDAVRTWAYPRCAVYQHYDLWEQAVFVQITKVNTETSSGFSGGHLQRTAAAIAKWTWERRAS